MEKLKVVPQTPQQYDEELEAVRARVLHMGGIVEEQLSMAIQALINGDAELARTVVENDALVNSLEVEIDDKCTQFIARQQPAASDLRLVLAIIKTINDLERIGDEVKRVGKMVREEMNGALDEEIRQELEHMGELVHEMLRHVLDAFARTDMEAAAKVIKADRKVDIKYKVITRQLITHMAQDPTLIPSIMNVMWAVRAMERMGDRCQNIAEYVIYLVIGVNVRHTPLDDITAEIHSGE